MSSVYLSYQMVFNDLAELKQLAEASSLFSVMCLGIIFFYFINCYWESILNFLKGLYIGCVEKQGGKSRLPQTEKLVKFQKKTITKYLGDGVHLYSYLNMEQDNLLECRDFFIHCYILREFLTCSRYSVLGGANQHYSCEYAQHRVYSFIIKY